MRYCKIENGVITEYNRNRKDFGVGGKSNESVCVAKGYYPIIDNIPAYDSKYQRIANTTYEVDETNKVVNKIYTIVNIPIDEIKDRKLQKIKRDFIEASNKPRVEVQLSDTLTIIVDGGRTNKDDFKEEWENMADDETVTVKDADNEFHEGITKDQMHRIYKAIVANGKALYAKKWELESQIKAATAIEDIETIQW